MNHMTPHSWTMQQSEIEARRERTEHKILAAILTVAVFIVAAVVLAFDEPRQLEAQCSTDTECAALCPADDLECDGGPQ